MYAYTSIYDCSIYFVSSIVSISVRLVAVSHIYVRYYVRIVGWISIALWGSMGRGGQRRTSFLFVASEIHTQYLQYNKYIRQWHHLDERIVNVRNVLSRSRHFCSLWRESGGTLSRRRLTTLWDARNVE